MYANVCKEENCKHVYIGETKRLLKYRLADHRGYIVNKDTTKSTCPHFNLLGHSLSDLSMTIVEQVKKNYLVYRTKSKENHIRRFNSNIKVCQLFLSYITTEVKLNTGYLFRNPVQSALRSNKTQKAKKRIFLAWHDPETRGVQELFLSLFKIHSWSTYEWKSDQFWWYFRTFFENAEGVLLKIWL